MRTERRNLDLGGEELAEPQRGPHAGRQPASRSHRVLTYGNVCETHLSLQIVRTVRAEDRERERMCVQLRVGENTCESAVRMTVREGVYVPLCECELVVCVVMCV